MALGYSLLFVKLVFRWDRIQTKIHVVVPVKWEFDDDDEVDPVKQNKKSLILNTSYQIVEFHMFPDERMLQFLLIFIWSPFNLWKVK